MSRPLIIEIDLSAVLHNLQQVRRLAPQSKVVACIKGNAYGHGMLEVAKTLESGGAEALCVSGINEAITLRNAGIRLPILLLHGCFYSQEWQLCAEQQFWAVLHSQQQLQQLMSQSLTKPVHIWVKVDTGMHRLGLEVDAALEACRLLDKSDNCAGIVLMSHLSAAENLENPSTEQQLRLFHSSVEGLSFPQSFANSAAVIAHPKSHKDWVRPGIMLYGVNPFDADSASKKPPRAESVDLRGAMSIRSRIIAIKSIPAGHGVSYNQRWLAQRDSRVAIIAVGYGDGYPATIQDGRVWVNQQWAPIVGAVTMDMLIVDITDIRADVWDKVEILGPHLPVADICLKAGLSHYELLTQMTPLTQRAQRTYKTT